MTGNMTQRKRETETEGEGERLRVWDYVSFNLVLGLPCSQVIFFLHGDFAFHPGVCVSAVCYKTVKREEP